MNKTVQSFDIFDTLLARTVKIPTDIFKIIETKFPYPNFLSLRIKSQELSNQTIDDIYMQFKKISSESDKIIMELKEFELQTEIENTIPIECNISLIKDNDIFVSDMYFNETDIKKILNYHGINGLIFVSSSGKSSGQMWEYLLQTYNISVHTGDNIHSDINMSAKYGIFSRYTNVHQFTYLENALIESNFSLCRLLRTFRLMNKWPENSIEYKLYDQQIKYNIPILLFICRKLANILEQENRNTVLFLTRDGCIIIKLFMFLYPQYKSIYCHSSRIINNKYNNDYISYLKSIYNRDTCIFFDIHGSFNSGRKMFMNEFGHLPRMFIFDFSNKDLKYDGMTTLAQRGNKLEQFNSDLKGTLVNFVGKSDIRCPVEFNLKFIKIMHSTVDEFIKYVKFPIKILFDIFNDDIFWLNFYNEELYKCENIFMNQMTTKTLTELANAYNSDKGTTYKCAHNYTATYEILINNLLNDIPDNFNLLEIGLNRDDTNTIPSLMIWNDYFAQNIHITGFDIQDDFRKFNGVFTNIDIVIGDQSSQKDLLQLKNKTYTMIIDDGYHASNHQQISFMELWENVKPGGYYIIEDLHYQPVKETCMKTKILFENWSDGNWISSEFINQQIVDTIKESICSIKFADSAAFGIWGDNARHALVYIRKKK
jgi:hypothetical protein